MGFSRPMQMDACRWDDPCGSANESMQSRSCYQKPYVSHRLDTSGTDKASSMHAEFATLRDQNLKSNCNKRVCYSFWGGPFGPWGLHISPRKGSKGHPKFQFLNENPSLAPKAPRAPLAPSRPSKQLLFLQYLRICT